MTKISPSNKEYIAEFEAITGLNAEAVLSQSGRVTRNMARRKNTTDPPAKKKRRFLLYVCHLQIFGSKNPQHFTVSCMSAQFL